MWAKARKHVWSVGVYLALGVVASVLMAWIAALANGKIVGEAQLVLYFDGTRDCLLKVVTRPGVGYVSGYGAIANGNWTPMDPLARYHGRRWWRKEVEQSPMCSGSLGYGWPMLCVAADVSTDFALAAIQQPKIDISLEYGVAWGSESIDALRLETIPVVLAYRPLWFGLVVNGIVYAAAFSSLVLGVGVARRTLRGVRGQCPACGYPRGASPRCSECGEMLRRSTRGGR